MEVDQPEVKVALNHDHQFYQKATRLKDSAAGIPNLEDFDGAKNKLSRRQPKAGDPYIPDPAVMRSYNIKVRARNEQYTRRQAAGQWRYF